MTILRRWLLLAALMLWQGGFMFYGAIVVPIGSGVLGSHEAQARITRPVTNYLNLVGALALGLWAWDLVAGASAYPAGRGRVGWLAWASLVGLLGLLVWLHLRLDELLDQSTVAIRSQPSFYGLHRWYLLVSTAQLAVSLLLLAWTLGGWRSLDRRRGPPA